ncbi:phage tail protein [Pedobacter sp. L105]|uniref:phage tail protein n=1 Tax=Pedobacter sp. L105 TaxID=1641871 RepID=UPI00131D9FB3|nr:tail fiber protein [Pedobacter sp. L105]
MDPLIGELRVFAFGIVPRGWALCDGTILPVQQNAALFSILGTQFGGNGTTSFALPDLRGRVPVHAASPNLVGQPGGVNNTTLTAVNMPAHTHRLSITPTAANQGAVAGNLLATTTDNEFAVKGSNPIAIMALPAIGVTGNSVPVSNMQPYLGLSICIAVVGVYPQRS